MFTTSVVTTCPVRSLLQYHWLYSLCCDFYSPNLVLPQLKGLVSPSALHLFCPSPFPTSPLATITLFSVFTGLILLFVFSFAFILFAFLGNHVVFVFLSLTYLLPRYPLSPSMLLQMAQSHPFLWLHNVYIYIYIWISHFRYSFVYWWTLGLLPSLGYCK